MLSSFNRFFTLRSSYGLLFIRLAVGLRLAIGAWEALTKSGQMDMAHTFFKSIGIPVPTVSTYISVYAQLICGILFILGLFTRPAALIMVINFIVAILAAHMKDSFMDAFVPWMILATSLCLLFTGAGKLSIDDAMSKSKRV